MKFRLAATYLLLIHSTHKSNTSSSNSVKAFATTISNNYDYHKSISTLSRFGFPTFNFPPRGGSTTGSTSQLHSSSVSSSQDEKQEQTNNISSSTTLKDEIHKAALSCLNITGPSTVISHFGSIPYINTSLLSSKNQHRVLFILGGPGAGKGTQSEFIVQNYKCIHLSVGELLRQERMRGSELSPHAELIESCLVSGKIVPVEISLALVRQAMDQHCKDSTNTASSKTDEDATIVEENENTYGQRLFLIDGFPRNFDNLYGWTSVMPPYASVLGALVYDCPISILEQRILSRAETSGRSDDNLISARKRFTTFQEQTMPVVHALEVVEQMQQEQEGKLSKLHVEHISGEETIEQVWEATKAAMDSFIQNDIFTANASLLKAIENKDLDSYLALCSKDMYSSSSSAQDVFEKYEVIHPNDDTKMDDSTSTTTTLTLVPEVTNVDIEIKQGTNAVVSYNRSVQDANGVIVKEFRETRVWSHQSNGWVCVHFVRKPLEL